MVRTKNYGNFPVKEEYKYLGIWLNETINPMYHFEKMKNKILFIENKLRIIPKKSITPMFVINLWTLFIRPLFDYALVHFMVYDTNSLSEILQLQRQSFKRTLGIEVPLKSK